MCVQSLGRKNVRKIDRKNERERDRERTCGPQAGYPTAGSCSVGGVWQIASSQTETPSPPAL